MKVGLIVHESRSIVQESRYIVHESRSIVHVNLNYWSDLLFHEFGRSK